MALRCRRCHNHFRRALFLVHLSHNSNGGLVPHGRRKENDADTICFGSFMGIRRKVLLERVSQGICRPEVVRVLCVSILYQHQLIRLDDFHARYCSWTGIHVYSCQLDDCSYLRCRFVLLPADCLGIGSDGASRAVPHSRSCMLDHWVLYLNHCRESEGQVLRMF